MALATRPKPSAHHKKRVGKHHKTTRHYIKPYLPYLPLVAIMAIGLFASSLVGSHGAVLGNQTDMSPVALLQETNRERQADDETVLQMNTQLSAAAQAKADDMVAHNYWSHNTPDGRQPWSFMTAAGYNYQLAGENLAYGFSNAAAVTTGWMNSTEHRANILNARYQDIGFGIATSPNFNGSGPETVVVAMYGTPVTAAATAANSQPTALAAGTTDSNVLGVERVSATQQISFVQLLTKGRMPWSVTLVAVFGAVALTAFAYRHGRAWRRMWRQSEAYVASHPLFDIFVVSIGTLSFVLSRSVGFIR